jgi:hypothetical protein
MSVAKFKNIARLVWSRERGREDGPPHMAF